MRADNNYTIKKSIMPLFSLTEIIYNTTILFILSPATKIALKDKFKRKITLN